MAVQDGPVTVERDGGVAVVINNDAPINRVSLEYIDALEGLVGELGDDRDVRVVVFTAEGDENFSVGMDLKQLASAAAHATSSRA